jgi:hypothetical protein
MTAKSYFPMSLEERDEKNQRMLASRLKQLRNCAETLLAVDELDGDREAEVLAQLVENSLDAYMRLRKVNRPEEEHWVMSHLAWERRRLILELEEETTES